MFYLYVRDISALLESETKSDSFSCIAIKEADGVLDKPYKAFHSDFISMLKTDERIYICTWSDTSKVNQFKGTYANYDVFVYNLRSVLNLDCNYSLKELFFRYFNVGSDYVTDYEMFKIIISSFLLSAPAQVCTCIVQSNKTSFCWFNLDSSTNTIKILGSACYEGTDSEKMEYNLVKSQNGLVYKFALTGVGIKDMLFILHKDIDIELPSYLMSALDIESIFKPFIEFKHFNELVSNLCSTSISSSDIDATLFTKGLAKSSTVLGLRLKDNKLTCSSILKRNYSKWKYPKKDITRMTWGIILDCEGNRVEEQGLRELGGVIFCEDVHCMIAVDTFQCTEVLLEDTLQQVIKNYEELMGRYIPPRGIPVLTFGGSDEVMIDSSIRKVGTKQFRKRLKKLFSYKDCREYIYQYISDSAKRTLLGVANDLCVYVVNPPHNALSDSLTLFNVLAEIKRQEDVTL